MQNARAECTDPVAGVIADDLSGALEMGAILVANGFETIVTIGCRAIPTGIEAVVIDTETRNQSVQFATTATGRAATFLKQLGVPRLFKKVDSTLRGPIGAELQVIHDIWGRAKVVFTPAYPRLGRTVSRGRLFADGVELGKTAFARDTRWPVLDSDVSSALPPHSRSWIRVCDAVSDQDLESIITGDTTSCVYAGSGGLGRVWAASLPRRAQPVRSAPHQPRHVLVVSGSHHPLSVAQAENARKSGFCVIAAPAVIREPAVVEAELSRLAATGISGFDPDLIVIFGGQTAASVLQQTRTAELYPVSELLTGIPLSRAHVLGRERLIVTKAGGFGSLRIVDEILDSIRRQ